MKRKEKLGLIRRKKAKRGNRPLSKPFLFIAIGISAHIGITAPALFADISNLPYWDQIPQSLKDNLLKSQEPQELLESIIRSQQQLPLLFTASALNMLDDQGASEVLAKLLLELSEERGLEVMRSRLRLYLLENRSENAQRLSTIMYEVFPSYRSYPDALELSMLLGQSDLARSQLNAYLNSNVQQSSADYARSIYFVARLFIAEGNEEAAVALLRKYFEEEDIENINSPYIIESAFILHEAIQSDPEAVDLRERIHHLVAQKSSPHFFPDQRLISTESASIPASSNAQASANAQVPARTNAQPRPSVQAPANAQVPARTIAPTRPNAQSTASARLIQIGSFGVEENARGFQHLVEHLWHFPFVYFDGMVYKVLIDPKDSGYERTNRSYAPEELAQILRNEDIDGFLVDDPRY